MGFYEDDRIRAKNTVHNEAYTLYENLRAEGLSDSEITEYVKSVNCIRMDISSAVQRIAGRYHAGDYVPSVSKHGSSTS